MQDGVADIAFIIPTYTAGRFPDNDIFELPLLIDTVEEGSFAAWRMFEDGQLRGYEGIKVLGLFAGVNSLHASFSHGRSVGARGPQDPWFRLPSDSDDRGPWRRSGRRGRNRDYGESGSGHHRCHASRLEQASRFIEYPKWPSRQHLEAPLGTAFVLVRHEPSRGHMGRPAGRGKRRRSRGMPAKLSCNALRSIGGPEVRGRCVLEVAAMEGQQRYASLPKRSVLNSRRPFAPIIEEWKARKTRRRKSGSRRFGGIF